MYHWKRTCVFRSQCNETPILKVFKLNFFLSRGFVTRITHVLNTPH